MLMAFISALWGTFTYMVIIVGRKRQGEIVDQPMFQPRTMARLRSYWVCSWTVVLSTFTGIICMKIIPISIFAIIYNLKPVLVMIMGFCAGQETLTLRKSGFIFLSFLGTGLIVDSEFFINAWTQIVGASSGEPAENSDPIERGSPLPGLSRQPSNKQESSTTSGAC